MRGKGNEEGRKICEVHTPTPYKERKHVLINFKNPYLQIHKTMNRTLPFSKILSNILRVQLADPELVQHIQGPRFAAQNKTKSLNIFPAKSELFDQ